jgi:hypothetical protein
MCQKRDWPWQKMIDISLRKRYYGFIHIRPEMRVPALLALGRPKVFASRQDKIRVNNGPGKLKNDIKRIVNNKYNDYYLSGLDLPPQRRYTQRKIFYTCRSPYPALTIGRTLRFHVECRQSIRTQISPFQLALYLN